MSYTLFEWLFLPGLLLLASGMIYIPKWREKYLRARQFTSRQRAIICTQLPIFKVLTVVQKKQLLELMQVFLARKTFYGCAALEVTETMRLSIAAQACLLLLGRKTSVYHKLKSILIYPAAFKASRESRDANGVVSATDHHMLGESWDSGRVILSWDDVSSGAEDFNDGQNVTLHEFAHQLDSESGATNGAPLLHTNRYTTWSKVLSKDYQCLQHRARRNLKTVMDKYGATNEAEFFAVATETFFERPRQLAERRPDLFEVLRAYYCLDPRDWCLTEGT